MIQTMVLKFDEQKFFNLLVKEIIKFSQHIAKQFQDEALNGLSEKAKDSSKVEHTEIIGSFISTKIMFWGNALLESYGKGSFMQTANPELEEYKNSIYWNPLRSGNEIVGRPQGSYIDFFGNEAYSTGKMAGKNLERVSPLYAPQRPTYLIQDAERWLGGEQGKIYSSLNLMIEKFTNENLNDCFYNEYI
ncbi:MAG TPA: hypothetical protein VJ083_07275 [Sedimentibacter sp.]|nr:hypothetical protein [Sedimentibacter sp.]